jgi:hypothetical protein
MTLNLELFWHHEDQIWQWFQSTELSKLPKSIPAHAVIQHFLYFDEDKKQLTIFRPDDVHTFCGMLKMTTASLREILNINKLSRDVRESRETKIAIDNYIKSLQS